MVQDGTFCLLLFQGIADELFCIFPAIGIRKIVSEVTQDKRIVHEHGQARGIAHAPWGKCDFAM